MSLGRTNVLFVVHIIVILSRTSAQRTHQDKDRPLYNSALGVNYSVLLCIETSVLGGVLILRTSRSNYCPFLMKCRVMYTSDSYMLVERVGVTICF